MDVEAKALSWSCTVVIRPQRQISKARQIAIGSDFLAVRRNFDVESSFAWPKSTRTVSKSPVPFKMWRAFVRRKDTCSHGLGSYGCHDCQTGTPSSAPFIPA